MGLAVYARPYESHPGLNILNNFKPFVSVHASAGSGKTYQLVNRVVNLLLQGVRPGGILAITFTRKAAGEMYERVLFRCRELTMLAEVELKATIEEIGLQATPAVLNKARNVYEEILYAQPSLRITTFHAFCQDLLRQFPIEANITPGFELSEHSSQLIDEAAENYSEKLNKDPASERAQAMEALFAEHGLMTTNSLLYKFIAHRSDWWAYSYQKEDAIDYIKNDLTDKLEINELDLINDFFQRNHDKLIQFKEYLIQHKIKANPDFVINVDTALNSENSDSVRYREIHTVFFTGTGSARKRSASKALEKIIGSEGAEEYIRIHNEMCEALQTIAQQLHARRTLNLTLNWLCCGCALLEEYQTLKSNRRILDFSDLEWKCYELLNSNEHIDWIQFKLDERIDHLLVDEFQDTNPTQWRLIKPVLEELASGDSERNRSVYFVGDSKQSIYRFRRADPELFFTASRWLNDNLNANNDKLMSSWRSSDAIIQFVNRLFKDNPDLPLAEFDEHSTNRSELWGQVTLLPFIATLADENKIETDELRNPLLKPLEVLENTHNLEANMVVNQIKDLINSKTILGHGDDAHPAEYKDILLLFKKRTQVTHFEKALREQNIPYIGADRGTLLESLEALDMINLLRWLSAPQDNHALAGILRSPIFSASNEQLLQLARKKNWFDTLVKLAEKLDAPHPFVRARNMLQSWMDAANILPVHDLLDRIYSDANIIERYSAAYPEHMTSRVKSNLIRFLELALENDSGRYPSLGRFIGWLNELRQHDDEAPDEPPEMEQTNRVRLMTIHAAKGLEAPIVFLVDSASKTTDNDSADVLVDWPADKDRPETLLITPKDKSKSAYIEKIYSKFERKEQQENANLLYVAVTRAQQHLYISASANQRQSKYEWYESIANIFEVKFKSETEKSILCESKSEPEYDSVTQLNADTVKTKVNVNRDFKIKGEDISISPSQSESVNKSIADISSESKQTDTASIDNSTGIQRGIQIHSFIEQLCINPALQFDDSRYDKKLDTDLIQACWKEAADTFSSENFKTIFDHKYYDEAYNEVPVYFKQNNRMVHGIIDRLVIKGEQVIVVDYKTHMIEQQQAQKKANDYKAQLQYYAQGIKQLWPNSTIETHILFTHANELIQIETNL